MSKKTVIDSVFRQILTKNLKNFVECRSILAKNVVEKNVVEKNVVEFYDSTPFSDGILRQILCRKMRSKKIVEPGRKILSKKAVAYCRKIPSKNVC